MSHRSPPLRVGSVPYLVARPLIEGLERDERIELTLTVPSLLVEQLRAGEVDVALVSSIELFRRPGYSYLSGSAIAGHGFVASVQVFLRKPIDAVRRVALDPASRTAQALARIELTRRARELGRTPPEFIEPAGNPESAEADAWLAIGDAALRRYLTPGAPGVFNPSEHWTRGRGLPFVFAAWVVRPGAELSPEHVAAFAAARRRGTDPAHVEALAREASSEWALPFGPCLRYLAEECRYDPGEDLAPALHAFRDEAAALGLCRSDLDPRPIARPADAATD